MPKKITKDKKQGGPPKSIAKGPKARKKKAGGKGLGGNPRHGATSGKGHVSVHVLSDSEDESMVSDDEGYASSEDEGYASGDEKAKSWVAYPAGGRAGKEHLVPEGRTGDIEGLYGGTPQVREMRSYEHEREKQALRWLSTVVFGDKNVQKGVEVQAYYDRATQRIIISTNTNAGNTALVKRLNAKNLHRKPTAAEKRLARHQEKLIERTGDQIRPEQAAILDAIENRRFDVPDDVEKDREGLHAERRIKEHLEKRDKVADWDMNDDTKGALGGVKRPCAVCAFKLGLLEEGSGAHPGPLWNTIAAMLDVTEAEVKAAFEKGKHCTHMTRSRENGALTWDYDTDSDSDKEGEVIDAS